MTANSKQTETSSEPQLAIMKDYHLPLHLLTPNLAGHGAVVCACAFLLLWSSVAAAADQEPSYKGRSLSRWLADIFPGQLHTGPYPPEGAVRAMGTNAIPTLLKWISYQASSSPASRSRSGEPPFGPEHEPTMTAEECAKRSVYAFRFLGAVARPAIPQLTRLARSSSDQQRAE